MADLNLKDAQAATAAEVRDAKTLFIIASGANQETPKKVEQSVMEEVFGVKATKALIYGFMKAILQASTNVSITTDDDNDELDIAATDTDTVFTPSKANLYAAVKAILQASTNVSITADDDNDELDIAATDTDTVFTPSKANLYAAVKAILQASTNVSITADDDNDELDIAATDTDTVFTPSKANLYAAVKAILQASTNVSITADDDNDELDIAASHRVPNSQTQYNNLGSSNTTILTGLNANDRIEIFYKETSGSSFYTDSWTFRFGDLSSSVTRRVISASGNNFAVLYYASNNNLVMRQGSGLNGSNFMRLSVYTDYYD